MDNERRKKKRKEGVRGGGGKMMMMRMMIMKSQKTKFGHLLFSFIFCCCKIAKGQAKKKMMKDQSGYDK